MKNIQRDIYVGQDYREGKEIHELSRSYGLSERRISQILQIRGIPRRPRTSSEKKALSRQHSRIGIHLYNFRFEHNIELFKAVEDLGWSGITIRKVEKGTKELELLDLMDIAAYTQVKIGELLENTNGN
jgi:hypothetical protein